jgi:hypothetical protein
MTRRDYMYLKFKLLGNQRLGVLQFKVSLGKKLARPHLSKTNQVLLLVPVIPDM